MTNKEIRIEVDEETYENMKNGERIFFKIGKKEFEVFINARFSYYAKGSLGVKGK